MSDLGNIASPDAFVLYLWGPAGPVMEFDTQGHSKAFLHDPLGNVVNTTTEDGRAQKPLFYDGYGLAVWPDEEESRVKRHPFQYKGQFGYYTDVHTGLSYCHNRYYDPRMGRWLSRDPIGLAGGTNVYTYCAGDPVNLVDPDGLQVSPGLRSFMEGYFSPKGDQWAFWKSMDSAATEIDGWIYIDYYRLHRHAATGNISGFLGSAASLLLNLPVMGGGTGRVALTSTGGKSLRTTLAGARLGNLTQRASAVAELTPAQSIRVRLNPSSEPMYRGERIETVVKEWASRDWRLRLMKGESTPRFVFGPDFRLRGTDVWFDITTEPQWARHVKKYGPGGYRIGY